MLRFNKKNHVSLCFIWAILLHTTTAIAQPDSIAYEDLSKFEDDLYWTNIYVDRITKDTIVSAHTTQDYFVKNKKGIKIVEGRMEGYDGHRCFCTPQKNGIWVERFGNGAIKSIETFDCGYKVGQSIYYFENGNRQRVENYAAPSFPYDTSVIYFGSATFLSGLFLEYYESGEIKVRGDYEINKKAIEEKKLVLKYNYCSKKIGTWNTYNKNGKIIEAEEFGY